VNLEQACEFLQGAASGMPAPVRAPSAPVERQDTDVREDKQMRENIAIRDDVACPVCGAAIGERCIGENGTLAFLHHGRVIAAAELPI